MGRSKKQLNIGEVDKREVGFYKTPSFVAEYITKRVKLYTSGKKVLDPCCGKEDLIKYFLNEDFTVFGMDIIKYKSNYECEFTHEDFIKYYSENKDLDYDIYIANPPYNCHEVDYIKKNKDSLTTLFKDVGTHNMYSMFISALIDLAKDGAVIGVICSDSFLGSKFHNKLRRKILDTCSIHEIILCPKTLFVEEGADVKTSIIILQKGKSYQGDVIVNNRVESIADFKEVLTNNEFITTSLENIILSDDRDNLEFVIGCPAKIKMLFNNYRLGEVYKCVTGISTGNDKKYISKEKTGKFTVPFYKNCGKDMFYTNSFLYINEDYMEISKREKNFNVRNREIITNGGVTCSSMGVKFGACKLPKNSTFGVNPNVICSEDDAWFLLAYLNSALVTYIVRGVILRGNMITSGYVSRIPLVEFSDTEKDKLKKLAKAAYEKVKKNEDIESILLKIDSIIFKKIEFNKEEINYIRDFNNNIVLKS